MSGTELGGRVPSLPPPQPRSPPRVRRELAKVQVLETEVSFLEDELKCHECLRPASLSCKEVTNFVLAKSDPLIPVTNKSSRSSRFLKWLCCSAAPCFNISWIFCCRCPNIKMPRCCNLCRGHSSCTGCSIPKCQSCCFCLDSCCYPKCPSSSNCSCPKVNCCNCKKHAAIRATCVTNIQFNGSSQSNLAGILCLGM